MNATAPEPASEVTFRLIYRSRDKIPADLPQGGPG